MAHTICGIDLGAFSIKFVMIDVGFRHSELRGTLETPVPEGDAPLLQRQAQAIRQGLSQVSGEATLYLAVPGDMLSIRLLDLPFTDARKIDQVIGYELEGQIVHALEDVLYDHVTVRSGDEGSTELAVAAKRDDIGQLLEGLQAQGIQARALFAAPVVYRALASVMGAPPAPPPVLELATAAEAAAEATPAEATPAEATPTDDGSARGGYGAILDLGHLRTNLCVIRDGQAVYARTIMRGGAQLTAAIAQAFGAPLDRAEHAKRNEARLGVTGAGASAVAVKLDTVLREALAPLVRELRQTLASFRAASKGTIDALSLTGGAARLAGLPQLLESELGTPVRILPVHRATEPPPRKGRALLVPVMDDDGQTSVYALASAIALAGSRGTKEIDLRRGPYVYRASFSVLRQKALHLGSLAAGVVAALALDVGAAMTNLGNERKDLDQQLKTATQELLGQPHEDAREVTDLMRKGLKEDLAPLPKATAFDLLDQISRKMPSADKIKLDIGELDIRPKKTFIKGTVDSAAAVDEISNKLKEIECFEEVTKGAITEVSDGGKQFTLTITSRCP
jgi:general secretion pathway protein L